MVSKLQFQGVVGWCNVVMVNTRMEARLEFMERTAAGWNQQYEGLEARFTRQESCLSRWEQLVERIVIVMESNGPRTGNQVNSTRTESEGEMQVQPGSSVAINGGSSIFSFSRERMHLDGC